MLKNDYNTAYDKVAVDLIKSEFGIDLSDLIPKWGIGAQLIPEKTLLELRWFETFIKNHPDALIVEVGVRTGELTTFLSRLSSKNNLNTHIYGIDLWEYVNGEAAALNVTYKDVNQMIKELGLKNVELLQMDSASSASVFEDNKLDLVIIDADHDYDAVTRDILAWLPKLKSGGYMLCHDIINLPGPRAAVVKIFGHIEPIDEFSSIGYHVHKRP